MWKFEEIDKEYLSRRKTFSENLEAKGLWEIVDQWPLYCGISNLARNIVISDLIRANLNVPGHVVEFGSWKGSNIVFMAKLLQIFDPLGSKMVHCFESFEGLETYSKKDNEESKTGRGNYKGSYK